MSATLPFPQTAAAMEDAAAEASAKMILAALWFFRDMPSEAARVRNFAGLPVPGFNAGLEWLLRHKLVYLRDGPSTIPFARYIHPTLEALPDMVHYGQAAQRMSDALPAQAEKAVHHGGRSARKADKILRQQPRRRSKQRH